MTALASDTGVGTRSVPPLGGLNLTLLRLELRRLLRNRRTMVFTLIMPPVFFLIFGTQSSYRAQRVGHGNVTAYIAVSMAVYGAMLACTGGGATVSVESCRATGSSNKNPPNLTAKAPLASLSARVRAPPQTHAFVPPRVRLQVNDQTLRIDRLHAND